MAGKCKAAAVGPGYNAGNEVKNMFRLILIGAGQRGMIYARYAYQCGLADFAALAEPDEERRQAAAEALFVSPKNSYASAEALFERGKIADAAIIASMDKDHFAQAMTALDLGYDLLLEKPISPDPKECLMIERKAAQAGRRVAVCHVLRYAPFFMALKALIDGGELGRVVSIQHNENIGNWHMAHSFVRGNWRNSAVSSPIIMQKSCHDMDLLVWLTGSRAGKLSSFGDLHYFKEENAPKGSGERCLFCKVADSCRFDARKMYLPLAGSWPSAMLSLDQSEDGLLEALRTGPYGRCVYRCDNNVCDHQVMNILFENGITATFNLSAFTNRMARTMKIMCEDGEIRASEHENRIEVIRFAPHSRAPEELRVIEPAGVDGGHGGGDAGLMNAFFRMLKSTDAQLETLISRSVESHYMAAAAEEARLSGQMVDMDRYRNSLMEVQP